MVCVYCESDTKVVNSRLQKKANQVWRRRKCLNCHAIFTTLEWVDASQAISIRRKRQFEPFSRDILLLSVYDSLRHRKTAMQDATELTKTIIGRLHPLISNAAINRDDLVKITAEILDRFDKVAATHYKAFHP